MVDYTQYCPYIVGEKTYQRCDITNKPCIGSDYPDSLQRVSLEKICDCPGKHLAAGEAGRVRDSLIDHSKRK